MTNPTIQLIDKEIAKAREAGRNNLDFYYENKLSEEEQTQIKNHYRENGNFVLFKNSTIFVYLTDLIAPFEQPLTR